MRRNTARFIALAGIAGIVSAGAFLAVAELIALLVARQASPILAVGSFVIDIVPRPLKEFAIATFGANDKLALLAGLGLGVGVAAAVAGILQLIRPPLGLIALGVAGVISTAAVVTRAGATPVAAVPSLAGAVVGCLILAVLVRRLRRWQRASVESETTTATDAAPRSGGGVNRRLFLRYTVLTAAVAAVAGIGARVVSAATSSLTSIRGALRLPAPASRVAVPADAELDIPGISPLFTPNADFYRVDTALTVPSVDPSTWRLVIDGMVDKRTELTFDELVNMGVDEYAITLTCVSNEVGGGLVGNATWLGIPVRDVLRLTGVQSGADMVLSRSADGFTASTPLAAVTADDRDAILAVAMNGEPLPFEHGFPVRMVVPGLYGYVSATKWLTQLTVTTFAKDQAYWTPRGYSAEAPIKMSSRIDTPRTDAPVKAGTVAIAGMAWAQTVGIDRVEVSIDDGDWQPATLAAPINDDTWVQWHLEWDAAPGTHYLSVRAADRAGNLQIEQRAPIAPNGSSGWQRTLVTVR